MRGWEWPWWERETSLLELREKRDGVVGGGGEGQDEDKV